MQCFEKRALTDNKTLALSKLKANADNNFIATQMVRFFSERIQNIVGKREIFSFSYNVFKRLLFQSCENPE